MTYGLYSSVQNTMSIMSPWITIPFLSKQKLSAFSNSHTALLAHLENFSHCDLYYK